MAVRWVSVCRCHLGLVRSILGKLLIFNE